MSINKNPATERGLIKSEVFHNSNITLHQPKYQKIALLMCGLTEERSNYVANQT